MKKIESKFEALRAHIIQKAFLVAKRISPKPSREVTNQEVALELYAEVLTNPSEVTPETQSQIEALHERMVKLDEREMRIIRLRYFENKLWEEVAYEMSLSCRRLRTLHKKALMKLRPEAR